MWSPWRTSSSGTSPAQMPETQRQHADYVAIAAELREQAELIDVAPEERVRYMPNNRREADIARHYRAWGLRAAAEMLEGRTDAQ